MNQFQFFFFTFMLTLTIKNALAKNFKQQSKKNHIQFNRAQPRGKKREKGDIRENFFKQTRPSTRAVTPKADEGGE